MNRPKTNQLRWLRAIAVAAACLLQGLVALGQDATRYNQFFINPYYINPSYAGIEGRPALFLGYRKQWAQIDGGPVLGSFSLHAPLTEKVNFGFGASNDKQGLITATNLQVTAGYTLVMDKDKFLRFGISAGANWNSLDIDQLGTVTDPALLNALDKNFSLAGNAGVSFNTKGVHIGVSIPSIFSPAYVSEDGFTVTEVKPFERLIIHASNRWYFNNDKNVFEPYVVYRLNQSLPSQWEAAAVVHFNHTLYVGASYRQDFGISAMGGVKMKNMFAVGYSYSLKNTGVNELNSPTHEFHLGYLFGQKKKKAEVYSFVNTEKEKIKTKPATMVAKKPPVTNTKNTAPANQKEFADAKNQTKTPATTVVKPPPMVKDTMSTSGRQAGTRFRQDLSLLDELSQPEEKVTVEQEAAKLKTLDAFRSNPTEAFDDTGYTFPGKHETVKRGVEPGEMAPGDYIVMEYFQSPEQAQKYTDELKKMGFAARTGYLSATGHTYVYLAQARDINVARQEQAKFRKFKLTKDAFILTVHE
jgi:type IX secretion system PorP/SprF family membrane protein